MQHYVCFKQITSLRTLCKCEHILENIPSEFNTNENDLNMLRDKDLDFCVKAVMPFSAEH